MAMSNIGVLAPGQPLSPEDSAQGLQTLNTMLDSWATERLFLYTTTELPSVTLPANTRAITVGPGGTVNLAERPYKLDDWGFVRVNNVDYRFRMVNGEQYSSIVLKNLTSTFPFYAYYDTAYPLANLFFYPVCTQDLELHLRCPLQLTQFQDTGTKYNFPQGYLRALYLSLAEELAPTYGKGDLGNLPMLATRARLNVKRATQQTPVLNVDYDLQNRRRWGFSIYTGE